jgi:hypothetical protein
MQNIIKALIGLSILAFVIAVLGSVFNFDLLGVDPEGYSRACSNIALVAIALALAFKPSS